MLTRNDLGGDLAEYLLDNYGECTRGADCYWGTDERGRENGCLKTGWKGRFCPHWVPTGATSFEELKATLSNNKGK